MQTPARGESRRRPQTPDPTRRRPTFPAPPVSHSSHLTYLASFLLSLTYLIAYAPSLPLLLTALSVTLISTFVLLPFRPSLQVLRLTFHTTHLFVLTTLHVSHILTVLIAIRFIGPVRSLISLGAYPSILHICSPNRRSRRQTSLTCILLTAVALFLLVYDVSVDAPAANVRERVLQTSAGRAVHARIQNFSHHMNLKALPFRRHIQNQPPNPPMSHTLQQPKPPLDPQPKPPAAPQPPPHVDSLNNSADNTSTGRRLMAIVKDEQHAHAQPEHVKPPDHVLGANNQSANSTQRNQTRSLSQSNHQHDQYKPSAGDTETSSLTTKVNTDVPPTAPPVSSSRLVATLGVILAVGASIIGRAATEMRERVMNDAGDWSAISVAVFLTSSSVFGIMLLVRIVASVTQSEPLFSELLSNAFPRGLLLSLSWFVIPILLHVYGEGLLRRSRSQRGLKGTNSFSVLSLSSSLLELDTRSPTVISFYFIVASTALLVRGCGLLSEREPDGALTYLAGALLVISAKICRSPASQMSRRAMTGSGSDLPSNLSKGFTSTIRSLFVAFRSSGSASLKGVKDLVVHARSNKASWQVLNFLILQSFMAAVELAYATITHSSGLFSISSDNFFCSVALAIGLIAIRISSRKPSSRFSYGYGRVESLCGFTNGIILIYIGILVILEAFERSNEDKTIAIGRAFFICLLGLFGNVLGLYFFPPESRRENHNVQGIYLHIWANTVSFARIALTTTISMVAPAWKSVDMISASVIGAGMVVCAIPLVLRSGRLLLLMSPLEREYSIVTTKSRLSELSGVDEVSALRIWNLTPNSLVASVRLKVSRRYEGSDAEILLRARAVFTMIGIAPSQCTIQITRIEEDRTESVVYLHKRSRSSLPDTGINVDMLACTSRSKMGLDNPEDNQQY